MLPSRLFRKTGLPPPLRSLLKPHPSLPAPLAAQLRLGVLKLSPSRTSTAGLSTAGPKPQELTHNAVQPPKPTKSSVLESQAAFTSAAATTSSQPLPEQMEPKLQISFTCTVEKCGERSTHQFTKRAYTKGIVIVQCPGCQNRHLIADHLGWFKESTEDGNLRTIEDLLRAKGEKVRRGRVDVGGVVEYSE
ncbi:DNL zinc finger-domain-containing protein [Cyathus striatus]|nr:DNL zinc finger-domain-containing protein [Cyathus striatus]